MLTYLGYRQMKQILNKRTFLKELETKEKLETSQLINVVEKEKLKSDYQVVAWKSN